MSSVNISPLMASAGLAREGFVEILPLMSGIEPDPRDDWMYLGLRTLRVIAEEKEARIRSIAGIGSGNGVVEIGMMMLFPSLQKLYVTDILPEILPTIQSNIEKNVGDDIEKIAPQYLAGADCAPLPEPVDLIYGNLPLIMVDPASLQKTRATTTLTDAHRYEYLGRADDPLQRWSLLSQLGFLLSAKSKLLPGGSIVTLIGERVPSDVIAEVFSRAGLRYRERFCAFKKQSDPEFLKEYAEYEVRKDVAFTFYDFNGASDMIRLHYGIDMPDTLPVSGDALRSLIEPTRLTAVEAYKHAQHGEVVGHIALAFETFV